MPYKDPEKKRAYQRKHPRKRTKPTPEQSRRWYRAQYKKNGLSIRAAAEKRRLAQALVVRKFIASYLETHACIDCGEKDPVVLEFDHRDDVKKSFEISRAKRGKFSMERVIAEVEKCNVRCANCHRRRHFWQRAQTVLDE